MTREEEITNAAIKEYGGLAIRHFPFVKGAEWADAHQPSPWISVEERLPKINDTVLWYDNNGEYRLGWLQQDKEFIFMPYEKRIVKNENMQYWMPIPELPTTK